MAYANRFFRSGGTYFFSVRLADPQSDLLVREVALLRDTVRVTRQRWPFAIEAAVVLPARLMMIWTLPDGDAEFSKRWRMIKSGFSRHVPAAPDARLSLVRKGRKGVWQRRDWEHLVRDRADFEDHRRMIENAPVAAGLVAQAEDWPFGSAFRGCASADFSEREAGAAHVADAAAAVQRSLAIPLVAGRSVGQDPPHPTQRIRTTAPAPSGRDPEAAGSAS